MARPPSSSTPSSSASPRRSPLAEVVENWTQSCLMDTTSTSTTSSATGNNHKSSTDLQNDAKTFFRYISQNTQTRVAGSSSGNGGGSGTSNTPRILQTRSSHEEALAQLIQQLGPAFVRSSSTSSSSSHDAAAKSSSSSSSKVHASRLRALHVLLGALEGCQEVAKQQQQQQGISSAAAASASATVSNGCLKLVGSFLAVHCGPVETNDDDDNGDGESSDGWGEDLETNIRDTALQALSVLVGLPPPAWTTTAFTDDTAAAAATAAETTHTDITASTTAHESVLEQTVVDAVELRTTLAQSGVEKRCALPDDDDNNNNNMMDTGYGYDDDDDNNMQATDIRGGLSTLPRSKRSLCFALLQGSVRGVSKVTTPSMASLSTNNETNVRKHLIRFTSFATRCIPGESDPRCLLQLLELLHGIQSSFQPWFVATTVPANQVFPNAEVFDAVAPYYPIEFTPPPNNPHGITREGLHSELISVLTFTQMDASARRHRKPTILSYSLNLFLEPLLPPTEDEAPSSTQEKFEAMESLSKLFFPTSLGLGECKNLTVQEVRTLTSALQTTHDEASRGVSLGGEKGEQNKTVADQCRQLMSRIALDLEKSDTTNRLWEAFVVAPLNRDTKKLKLSPAYCKLSIAYAACLAACGGPRTLRVCLSKGLLPLLEFLKENMSDTEDTVAATHGCAAFFSSCQVAIEKSKQDGVRLHPHPLEPYASQSCDLMLAFVERNDANYSWSLRLAVATSLECLLETTTQEQLGIEELPARICGFLKGMLQAVKSFELPAEDQQDYIRYQEVSSQALGRIVGTTFKAGDTIEEDEEIALASEGEDYRSILFSKLVKDCVLAEILPALMSSAMKEDRHEQTHRYDRGALSIACSVSAAVADSVVQSLLAALLEALKQDINAFSTLICLSALSSVISTPKNDNTLRAFHASGTPDEILNLLCRALVPATMQRQSLSQLVLPETDEEHQENISNINGVDRVVRGFLPAYTKLVPEQKLLTLMTAVVDKLPPLSKTDEGDLFVRVPILSAALSSCPASVLEALYVKACDVDESTTSLLGGLTEYILNDENVENTRMAAGVCVCALIKNAINRNLDCPVASLAAVVSASIAAALSTRNLFRMKNGIYCLSLLGSAAALRGSSSGSTAESIASFLVEASCSQSTTLSLASNPQSPLINMESIAEKEEKNSLQMTCASAYGAMLTESSLKPLMRQRLVHVCFKYVNTAYEKERGQAVSGESIAPPPVGLLMIACHLISARDVTKGDSSMTRKLATIAVEGLSSELFGLPSPLGQKFPAELSRAKTFVLSAVLKLICMTPASVNGLMLTMVSGLLRSFAVSNVDSEVGCKLIALQALEQLAHLDGARASILAVKPAVVAILASAMNQRSGLLRSAAVDVRNAWCIVD